jgi:hypothetical protein
MQVLGCLYSKTMFNFIKKCQSIAPSVYVSILTFVCLFTVILGMQWYVIVALICISLVTNDVEPVFICHLHIFIGKKYA